MSDVDPNTEPAPVESADLALGGDTAFTELMGFLAPEEMEPQTVPDGGEAGAATTGTGAPAPEGEAGGAADANDPAPAGGAPAGGEVPPGAPAEPAASGEPVQAEAAGVDAAAFEKDWGKITQGLEQRQTKELEELSLAEVRQENPELLNTINMHPRSLIGKEVPSIDGKGTDILRDEEDARSWVDATKSNLLREVGARAAAKAEEVRPMMETLHNSVALFQNNPDLIPGTKQFDQEFATRVAALLKPYELRVKDKLLGYTIQVQPLVTQVRQELTKSRSAAAPAPAGPVTPAAPAAPAGVSPQQQRAAEQPRNEAGQFSGEQPQAGIPSRAGGSAAEGDDDFQEGLFGTLGIPDFRV